MIPFKQTKKKLLVEIIIVVLILSTLSPMMFSKFLQSQNMARLKQNEEELKKMLAALEVKDNHFRKILFRRIQSDPNVPYTSQYDNEEMIADFFPDNTFNFDLDDNDFAASIFLGLDTIPNPDDLSIEKKYPLGVFIVLNGVDKQT